MSKREKAIYKRAYRNAIRDVIAYVAVIGYFTAIFVGFLVRQEKKWKKKITNLTDFNGSHQVLAYVH